MRVPVLACMALLLCLSARSQGDSATYRVLPWVDGSIIVGSALITYAGVQAQGREDRIPLATVLALDPSTVNAFDRAAVRIDLGERDEAIKKSDLILNVTAVAPALLLLDRRVRREWQPVLAMYLEAALGNSAIQTWTAYGIDRYRPITYLSQASLDDRTDARNNNSFFSGHTSGSATASFFMAKVLDDLHPELGWKRWLLYGGAIVPPALAGWFRVRAGKHFPSDVLTGMAFGAAVGVLVPDLHKRTDGTGFSLVPCATPSAVGLTCSWVW